MMKKNILQVVLLMTFLFLPLFVEDSVGEGTLYDIRKYGAKGDGQTLNTNAINSAIEDCFRNGGGKVLIPSGVYLTGTIYLKDNITIYLHKEAVLKGTSDVGQYKSYIPLGDLTMFDSGEGGENANSSVDPHWNRALILGVGVSNVTIEGEGIIDGNHVFDPEGEEKMRGPHAVIFAESRNLLMSGVTMNCASNYAFMAYKIEDMVFHELEFNEGWDGIHIRGGKNITIRNCRFFTGDDAIAGGYWENMVINDCYINSSCNGIRMIMPAIGLTISNCVFAGPGKYAHRTSKEKKRNNMLSAIILQPGGWGKAPGKIKDVHIHDISIDTMNNPLMIVLNEGNTGNNILVERMKATHINQAAISIESWKGGTFSDVTFRDISVNYIGDANPELKNIQVCQPPADSRPLPCWGWYARNVENLVLENVRLNFHGEDIRPAFWLNNIGKAELINVNYPGCENKSSIVLEHTGTVINK